MLNAVLNRQPSTDQGTIGALTVSGVGLPTLRTMEPPWRDNRQGISCIPCGEYLVKICDSPKYGRVYTVRDVPGRGHILLHWGNFGGDKALGFRSDTQGCILLGAKSGRMGGQLAVLASRLAFADFMSKLGGQPFKLTITQC